MEMLNPNKEIGRLTRQPFIERHPVHLYFLTWTVPFFLFQLGATWVPAYSKMIVVGVTAVITLLLMFSGQIKVKLKDLPSLTLIAGALYLVWILLSSQFGAGKGEFWIYRDGRYEGMIAFFSYFVIFFAARSVIKVRDSFWIQLCLSSTLNAVLRIWEHHGLNAPTRLYVHNKFEDWEYPFATFGNPNFFATFICLSLPVTVYLLVARKKYWSVLPLAVQVYALFINRSRSGMLGLLVSIPLFVILHALNLPGAKKSRVWFSLSLLLLALSLILTGVYYFLPDYWKRFSTIFTEMVSAIKQLFDGTPLLKLREGGLRIPAWAFAFRILATFPLFGTGLGAHYSVWQVYVDKYFGNAHFLYDYDRVHNEPLQIAAQSGLPALVFWWAFVGSILRSGARRFRSHPAYIMLFSAIIGHLVQGIFNISMVGSTSFFFMYLGILSRDETLEPLEMTSRK